MAFDEDDDEDDDEGKYAFCLEDLSVVDALNTALRGLLTRDDLAPRQISELGVFLYALERLPMFTEGVSMTVRLGFTFNSESNFKQIEIDGDGFRLTSGGYKFTPGIGGDSFITTVFEVAAGEGRDGESVSALAFADSFAVLAGDADYEVVIEDNSDGDFKDWDQPVPSDPWADLESEDD